MIVYRCKCCSAKYIFFCDDCQGIEFDVESSDMASPEAVTILAQPRPRNFDPIGGVKVRETSNSDLQREQMAGSAGKDFFFGSKVGECRTNEETGVSNLRTRPKIPGEQEQLLDSTNFEFRWNEDSDASNVPGQDTALVLKKALDDFIKSQTAFDTLSPELQKILDQTQTSHSSAIESQRNEDFQVSNFRSQHIPLEQEQLGEHFGKNHSALNSSQIQITGDQTQTSLSKTIEYSRNENVEASNFNSQHSPYDLDQLLSSFSKYPSEMNTSSSRIQNTWCETQASLAQGNDAAIGSNFNPVAISTNCLGANPQRPMNHHDQPSNTEQNYSIETILGNQTTAEYSRIENQDGEKDFSGTTPCRIRLAQSVKENFIIDHDARDAHFSAESGNPSSLQQGGHSSKTRKMESAENYTAVHAPQDCSASTTANPRFECEKCTRKFKIEKRFNNHMEAHEKHTLLRCGECPEEFRYESQLRQHYERTHKWPCYLCDHESKLEQELLCHLRNDHSSLLSGQELECDSCLRQFIEESKDNTHVRGSNDDPNAFKCDQCSAEFNCMHEISLHYETAHEGRFKRFKCNVCGYATAFRQNLTMHQNTAHDKGPI